MHKVWNLKKLDHLSKEIYKNCSYQLRKTNKTHYLVKALGEGKDLLKRNLKPHLAGPDVGIEPEFILLEWYGKPKP